MSSIYGSASGANVIYGKNNYGVAFGGAAEPATYPDSCTTTTAGIVTGAVINTANEKLGSGCLSFDGTDDFVTCNGWISCPVMDDKGTLAFWVYFNAVTGGVDATIFNFGDTDGNTFFNARMSGDDENILVTFRVSGTNQWRIHTTSGGIAAETWYHVAVTQDGTAPKIYLNGANDTTFVTDTDKTVWLGDLTGADNGRLGCRNFNSGGNLDFLDGLLDDMGIYNKDIGSSLISDLYNSGTGALISSISTDGCTTYYNFDSINGTLSNNATPTS